ncbi:MAG TPA: hypothetical protein DF296_05105 [Candidatus Margulisbacteria bacterium]|nr:MAG: hypothetical protein A2X43_04155 [Candidatus Margulisbacteria bacterium GWD2_39_127]OGI05193.1 MAG: hypothetical protein A2X42_02665 [Candidatus Margulisbacteria bacterium GWF2_38_17]OGI06242.1 MAG: hypothetical protein A2X41_08245 [Candidatus Margulisbacteria bacterium GWE2_39_32]HAR64519.1 hypothetical protein [Candidatus Margulisiibacteriota bacterium]HCT84558.1 hypothetical protein [Candidatus Margulisiibacteriota bacterium]
MEIALIDTNTFPYSDFSTQDTSEEKGWNSNFKKLLEEVASGELDGNKKVEKEPNREKQRLTAMSDTDKESEKAVTEQGDKNPDKKVQVLIENVYYLVPNALMIRELENIVKNKNTLSANNKEMLDDIESVISALKLRGGVEKAGIGKTADPGLALNSFASNQIKDSGNLSNNEINHKSQQTSNAELNKKINDLLQKFPLLSDQIHNAIAKASKENSIDQSAIRPKDTALLELQGLKMALYPGDAKRVEDPAKAASDAQDREIKVVKDISSENKTKIQNVTVVNSLTLDNQRMTNKEEIILKKVFRDNDMERPLMETKVSIGNILGQQNQSQLEPRITASAAVSDAGKFRNAIIDQIDNGVKMHYNPPQNEVRMKLNPPMLGEVTIKVQLVDDKMQAGKQVLVTSMIVESESVKDAVMAGANQLKQSLQEQTGLQVKDFSVIVRTGQEFTQQQKQNELPRSIKKRRFSVLEDDDKDVAEVLSEVGYALQGILDYKV